MSILELLERIFTSSSDLEDALSDLTKNFTYLKSRAFNEKDFLQIFVPLADYPQNNFEVQVNSKNDITQYTYKNISYFLDNRTPWYATDSLNYSQNVNLFEVLNQKQDQHHNRHDVFDHKTIQLLPCKALTVFLHLTDDPVRANHPADQDTRQQGNKRHQKAVADIVHHVEQLSGGTVWQRQFKVKHVVAKADQHRRYQRINADQSTHLFARLMKYFHTVCNQRFHNGYTRCQRRKAHHQEKGDCHDSSCASHRRKNLRQRNENQAGTGRHALFSKEHINRRQNHHSSEECNSCIKNFDLARRFI